MDVKKAKKILISGYYGFSNSGDDAILTSICKDIKELSDKHEITILSKIPSLTKEEYGADAIYRFNLWHLVKGIYQCDLLLMGGGSLLQDETSSKSLYYYLFILGCAKLLGKKVMLYANGIGPVRYRFNRKLAKGIVNKIDLITLREKLSYKELKHMGINKPEVHITADPVFTFPELDIDVDAVLEKEGIPSTAPLAGVFFRPWEEDEVCVKKIATVCDYIHTQYGMTILLIPMKYPSDMDICYKISKAMQYPSFVLKEKCDAKTMIQLIETMELVLSMRLHALLYAALKNVPMIGFSYSPKVAFYMKELDMPCVEQMTDFTVEDVKNMTDKIYQYYDETKSVLEGNVALLKEKAKNNKKLLEKLLDL